MLIGLSGKKRIGKSTAAMYLELKYDFYVVGFADALKRYAAKLGWNNRKDERGRKLLQDLGMTIRAYDPRFWVDEAFKQVKRAEKAGYTNVVIPDVRFRNEVEEIKERGGIVIRVWGKHEITTDAHPSETELDNLLIVDYKVESILGDFNQFYKQLDEILAKEQEKLSGAVAPKRPIGSVMKENLVRSKTEKQPELNLTERG